MTDSNKEVSNKELPADNLRYAPPRQNEEHSKLNDTQKIIESIIGSIIKDKSIIDIIMALKSNPDSVAKFEIKEKMTNKFYNKLFWFTFGFAFFISIIGGIALFLVDTSTGEKIIFAAMGLVGGFLGGFGAGLAFRNNE